MRLPDCDFCMHRDEKKDCCPAFPEGIPLEMLIKAGPGVDCGNGYAFQKKENSQAGSEDQKLKADGILSRLLDTL